MTEIQYAPFDYQHLATNSDDFTWESDSPAPAGLAAVLIFSGYVDLGASLLRWLYPDARQWPENAKYRRRLIGRVVRAAHLNPIQHDMPEKDSTDTYLHITAYRLHTDRIGEQLQRIADFLQKTDLRHMAELIRRQPPTPYPRNVTSAT